MARYIATMTFEVFASSDEQALAIAEHHARLQDQKEDDRAAIRALHSCPVGSLEERNVDIITIRLNRP